VAVANEYARRLNVKLRDGSVSTNKCLLASNQSTFGYALAETADG